jgi:hypothetical protein
MFVFDAAALLTPTRAPAAAPDAGTAPAAGGQTRRALRLLPMRLPALRLLPMRLLGAAVAQHRLLQRHRALPRPAGCGWVPRRAWRRHSALLCLCAGVDPDASTEDGGR